MTELTGTATMTPGAPGRFMIKAGYSTAGPLVGTAEMSGNIRPLAAEFVGTFASEAKLPTTGLTTGDWASIAIPVEDAHKRSGLTFYNAQWDGSAWSIVGKLQDKGTHEGVAGATQFSSVIIQQKDTSTEALIVRSAGPSYLAALALWQDSGGANVTYIDSAGAFTTIAALNVAAFLEAVARITLDPTDKSINWGDGTNPTDVKLARIAAGQLALTGNLAFTSDISPAQLVANTDNWAPTGIGTASVVRASTDASRNLTGIAGGADGRVLYVCNIGGFNLVLKHDVTSTAANRFYCPGSVDLTLTPNSTADLLYDSTSSRWRVS